MFGKPSNSSFSSWMEQQRAEEGGTQEVDESEQTSLLSIAGISRQWSSLQDNVASQLQDLSGQLPDAGPLSAAFRARITNAIYLILASVGLAFLAIFVGLPTIVFRPSKFVILISMATLCAASSVVVLQTPSVFLANLVKGGPTAAFPIVLLFLSVLLTLYITIFIHRFLFIVLAGSLQVLCILYYLATFIPGGTRGLEIMLKTAWMLVKSTLGPCWFIFRKSFGTMLSCLISTVTKRLCNG